MKPSHGKYKQNNLACWQGQIERRYSFTGFSEDTVQTLFKKRQVQTNLEFALHILHTTPDSKIDKAR